MSTPDLLPAAAGPMRDEGTDRAPPWLQLLLVVLVVLVGYGIGPDRIPLKGEETCRAQHGIEMARSGDWLIAKQQGVPILDRPPLQYWTLAAVHTWVHPLDPFTLRSFMALVTLLTAAMIWWYARRFLSPTGACLAAVAYPTMGHVADLGRRVETDGLFTLLLAASLLVWHHGHDARWRPAWTWVAGCGLAALATLAKGLQGPVAFFGTVYLFLLLRREWRLLFGWAHVLGLGVFILLIAVWQVPFYFAAGWDAVHSTWLEPGGHRFSTELRDLLAAMTKLPLETLAAIMPWSPLLFGLLLPAFWRRVGTARSATLFALIGSAAIFTPVWINVGGHPRYVMPMYPLLAVACGALVQSAVPAGAPRLLTRLWTGYLRLLVVVFSSFLAVVLVATIAAGFLEGPRLLELAQPWPFMAALLPIGAVGCAAILYRPRTRPLVAVFTLAMLLAILFNGVITNTLVATSARVGPQIEAARAELPPGTTLISFEPLHHKFVYWYGEPIPILPWPGSIEDVPEDATYFAANVPGLRDPELPFAYERVALFNMDRRKRADPADAVGIYRRTPGGPDRQPELRSRSHQDAGAQRPGDR